MRPTLILTHIAVVIATVVFLELNGKLAHNEDKTARTVGTFTAVLVDETQGFRMSGKSSGLVSECDSGYLVIVNPQEPKLRGVLVDFKNRGVPCETPATTTTPAAPVVTPAG